MTRLRTVITTAVVLGALGAIGGAAFVLSGVYDISAVDPHTKPVYWLIEATMRRSVAARAKDTAVPDLASEPTIARGFAAYVRNCEQCHGGPGVSPGPAALGMMPVPAYLVTVGREWPAAEVQWVVKNGIKATGMPAWKHRMSDDEIWEVVAFVKHRLPYLSAAQYGEAAAKIAQTGNAVAPAVERRPGNADAGRRALDQYACTTCHVIPLVTGATKHVGPPLAGIARRSYIGGALANTPENMVRWLRSPPSVKPGTAMPDLGVSEQDARDLAAYLATLK
ncbi:MAG TPA: c-type cytochrome [Burkholderiales bacterium]|nr:c-type cytochrome [Burkholderiales bacterium]